VSTDERTEPVRAEPARTESTADTVAGFLAAAALFAALLSIVWYPGRVGPAAILVALIASAISGPQRRLAAGALAFATACWVVGMIIAILTERPIF
jgi:hypothetical protein